MALPAVTCYRLASTDTIHTPGLLAWLRNVYQTDRRHAVQCMDAGWPTVPADVRRGLLEGSIPYTVAVDGTTVVVEVAR